MFPTVNKLNYVVSNFLVACTPTLKSSNPQNRCQSQQSLTLLIEQQYRLSFETLFLTIKGFHSAEIECDVDMKNMPSKYGYEIL